MSDSNSVMRCRPAGAGKQCAAAFVDCGFVLLCGVIAALLGHNIPVTFLVMLESVAVLAIGEGSRGLTPGNMMFGLRTVRVEGMRDVTAGTLPAGMGRILVKYCVLIGSTLALVIGLIAVICSPLFAKDDLHQGWADRLASLGCVDIHQRVEALEEQPVVSRQIPPVPMPRMQPTPPVPLPKTVADVSKPVPMPTAKQVSPVPMPSGKPMYPVRTTVEQQTASVPVTPPEKPQTFLFFEDGSKRTLSVPSSLILGRKPAPQQTGDIALAVPDHTGTVSRNHARIELVDDQIWITDLASTNGTRVLDESGEETELEPNVRTRMHVGSRIGLGDMGCSIITSKSRRR